MASAANALELRTISKSFGSLKAVDAVDLELRQGEIHTVLGENGAGKSTLMNLIYGLCRPDSGEIRVVGEPTEFHSPKDAIANGIGMVHQHFMLVPNLTVAENIALSLPNQGFRYRREHATQITRTFSERFGLSVEPNHPVWQLSVGIQQRVEILKALAVEARILILDEPTAVLAPQEVQELFVILDSLRKDGRTIVFISHKLQEVLQISDRITVMRRGKKVYTASADSATQEELAQQMVGHELQAVVSEPTEAGAAVLEIRDLTVKGARDEIAVHNISLQVRQSEIVGIAGVDGNGQVELAQAIVGLRHALQGSVSMHTSPITNCSPAEIRGRGVGYIPEDRQLVGLLTDFSVSENLILDLHSLKAHRRHGLLDKNRITQDARDLISDYDIRTPSEQVKVGTLSGGNQQKIVLAREVARNPELLVAVNPTRGLDIGATGYVHRQLLQQRQKEKAVLLISTELEEVLSLSDRLFVMHRGRLIDATADRDNPTALGLLMTGTHG